MNRIKSEPLLKKNNKKKMNKKEQPVRFEPRKCSLWFSSIPPRYHLSYLDFIDQLCIYPIMKGKSHNFVNKRDVTSTLGWQNNTSCQMHEF